MLFFCKLIPTKENKPANVDSSINAAKPSIAKGVPKMSPTD